MNNIKLTVENFRNIEYKQEAFTSGINIIQGNNGKGKSSLLLAFKLALYNNLDYKLEDCINWNTTKTYFNILLEFDSNSKHFKIDYTYDEKKKTVREVYINNEVYKNTDAVKQLEDYFDPSIELTANCINQNEEGIVNIKPAERRNFFKKIHNLEFKQEIDTVKLDIETIDKGIIDLDKKIYMYDAKQYNYKDLLPNMYTEKDITDYTKQVSHLTKDLNIIDTLKAEYNSKQIRFNSLITKQNEIDNTIDKCITNIKFYNSQIEDLNITIKNISDSKVIDIQNLIKSKELELSEIKIDRLPVFDESKIKDIEKVIADLNYELRTLNESISLHKQGKCPTCKRDFEGSDLNNLESSKQAKLDLIASNTIILNELKTKKADSDKLKEEQTKLKDKKITLENDIKVLHSKLENEEQAIITTKQLTESKIENNKNMLLNEQDKMLNAEKELSLLKVEVEELNESINKIVIDDKEELKKKGLIVELNAKIKAYNDVLTNNESILIHNKDLDTAKINDTTVKNKLVDDKNKELHNKSVLVEVKLILEKKLPNYIISSMMENIQTNMNDFINTVYDKSLNVKISEKKDSIYIYYGPAKEKDITLASGYEKQIINLAYKKAISKLSNSNILILDEADSASSDENALIFYKTLFDNSKLWETLIIVSHKDLVKDLVYNYNDSNIIEV